MWTRCGTTGNGNGSGSGIGDGSGGGTGGGPYRPGSGIQPPRLVHEVKAIYTDEGRRRNVTGDVLLEIVVRRDGSVGDVSVLRGLGAGLDQQAIDAVRANHQRGDLCADVAQRRTPETRRVGRVVADAGHVPTGVAVQVIVVPLSVAGTASEVSVDGCIDQYVVETPPRLSSRNTEENGAAAEIIAVVPPRCTSKT